MRRLNRESERQDYNALNIFTFLKELSAANLDILDMRKDDASGLAAVMMAPAEDCFAVATPYNKAPPDGVAGHKSLYLSLFGRDLGAGQTARGRCRLVVGRELSDRQIIERYFAYVRSLQDG